MSSDVKEPLSAEPDPRVGAVLQERYRVLEPLAAGGMGVVYRGERVKLQRPVAIKFLNRSFAANSAAMKRFEREAMTMSRLNHPNCVSVIDIGVHEEAPFIVMDFVTGATLKQLLASTGRLPPGRAIHIVQQILLALSHAHESDMVHRDIKPANVMVSDASGTRDHVLVLDFGLAKFQTDALGNDITATHTLLGTPAYMSPEQFRRADVGPSSDIYSTGAVLFQLLTGEQPYTGASNYDLMQAHKEQPVPGVRRHLAERLGQPPEDIHLATDQARESAIPQEGGPRARECSGQKARSMARRAAVSASEVSAAAVL